ncbi:response regulator transcription factor [Paenibacillus sp. EKM202P]|uniref:response regulator transcription factor n=1 Tax=unclassified Paenibacillus TaxID=185978 RepID=UPI0013E9FB9A|nr:MULTISPECIES: response regulator transcription factor [unclassified Paenibacillus]KAF6562827.1 response regulator transcription factor [Paenibacillus sp. EKM202P]KAF6568975.1 response regulator transcription factor [Paenibacillus sp. EKM207P]
MNRILIVEDDLALSNGITLALKGPNNEFVQTHDLSTSKEQLASAAFDLVILDLNLPDGNGLDFLTDIRKTTTLPVIILTAHDMETDIVTGLELGADDYITKPFSLMVLRARVDVQLKKNKRILAETIQIDAFSFSFDKMAFAKKGTPVELSKTEQKLLRLLIDHRGKILTRDHLVDSIWTDGAEYVGENALSVTIKRLRDKLEDLPSSPQYIKTVYGIGYTWAVK